MTPPLDETTLDKLRNAPMPPYDGYEPDELSLVRIQRYIEDERFDELPKEAQRWVCRRLMPSLMRFGCYPPPEA